MVKTAWLRRTTAYGITATMACFGFTGVVSAQTITNTGPNSTNTISSSTSTNCTVTNNNNVSAHSTNDQTANTGDSVVSGNTTAGLPWTGWNGLNPETAMANGQGYGSWFDGIINWVSNRSSGAGWNSNESNLSWTPSTTGWSAYDPMTWQANGQSFGNWYNSLQAYMNENSANWMLTWSPNANGESTLGTSTGDATNSNSANFSININNASHAVAGTDSCGRSNFTPPPATGGMGGGWTAPAVGGSYAPSKAAPRSYIGGGSGSARYTGGTTYRAPVAHSAPVHAAPVAPSAPAHVAPAPVAPPVGGSGGGAAPANSISNTGPGSTNTISTTHNSNYQVTNNNNVSATSVSTQTATTGNSTSSGNTTAGGPGTGNASNGNSAGTGVGVSN